MPTRSCSADLTKSCCYKRLYVSHKTIAGRAWINGIRFNNGRSTLLGALHRCFDDLFRQSLSAQLSTNEKADQRPYLFRTFDSVVRTAKVTVCWPRGDRAPCNGLTFGIAEQPDWHVIADILLYRSFPIRTLSGLGTGSPHHAPAVFWSAPALEQALEISPACGIYVVKLKTKHALHDSESARWCNQCTGHERQFRHVRRSVHLRQQTRWLAVDVEVLGVIQARPAQNRSTAVATALATVALPVADESTCSSARLTIIPASTSTAGICDSYSTAI